MPDPVQKAAKDTPSVDHWYGRYTIFGVDGEHRLPYMTRYWIGRLRLHIFHRGDNDPDPHDHPWGFWTFPLTSYVEEVTERHEQTFNHGSGAIINPPIVTYTQRRRVVRAFWPHYRPATHTHRVLGRYSGIDRHDWVGKQRGDPPEPVIALGAKIVTLVWREGQSRKWGFLKNRDGQWCWVPWKEYVFHGGKHGPCE